MQQSFAHAKAFSVGKMLSGARQYNNDKHRAFLVFSELAKMQPEISGAFEEIIHCHENHIGVEKNDNLQMALNKLKYGY